MSFCCLSTWLLFETSISSLGYSFSENIPRRFKYSTPGPRRTPLKTPASLVDIKVPPDQLQDTTTTNTTIKIENQNPALPMHDIKVPKEEIIPLPLPPEVPQIKLSEEQENVLARVSAGHNIFFTGAAGR